MEKDRGYMVIAIVALCVAIVGLSIGFAAFTRELNISFSESNVEVSGDLNVKFLASNNVDDTSTTVAGGTGGVGTDNAATSVNIATISTDRTTISGLGATFSGKDQAVGYDFYIYNNSEYDAYLKGIDFLNYTDAETNKVCTALEGTTQSLVDAACEDIHIMVLFGSETAVLDTSTNSFTSPKIPKGEMIPVSIVIGYAGDAYNTELGKTGSALLPNGDFKINFGDIKFSFSSLES